MSDTQVAEAKTTAVANIMEEFEAHAGAGMDAIGTEDMQIPFLRILQPLSPQLIKSDPKYLMTAATEARKANEYCMSQFTMMRKYEAA